MATATKTKKTSLETMDLGAIALYIGHRIFKRYIAPNATAIWAAIAAGEATYILIKGIF